MSFTAFIFIQYTKYIFVYHSVNTILNRIVYRDIQKLTNHSGRNLYQNYIRCQHWKVAILEILKCTVCMIDFAVCKKSVYLNLTFLIKNDFHHRAFQLCSKISYLFDRLHLTYSPLPKYKEWSLRVEDFSPFLVFRGARF